MDYSITGPTRPSFWAMVLVSLICAEDYLEVPGIACFVSNIVSISITVGLLYVMSPIEVNWGAKTAFLFAGLGTLVLVWAYFCLPGSKGRTFEEIDILFECQVPAKCFASTDLTDYDRDVVVRGGIVSPI